MQVTNVGVCGTLQSNDCLIKVEPSSTLEISIESSVKKEFGEHIEALIRKTLQDNQVSSCALSIEDKGALDCTIVARLQTALERSQGKTI